MMTMKNMIEMDTIEVLAFVADTFKSTLVKLTEDYVAVAPKHHKYVLLVAHADVFHTSKRKVEEHGDIIFASGCDDRIGVYAVMELHKALRHTALLVTNYEEVGGLGAMMACHDPEVRRIINNCCYIIELDRRGFLSYVTYHDIPWELEKLYRKKFSRAVGTFSDIAVITDITKRPSLNISIGFYGEHTQYEYAIKSQTVTTINILKEVLSNEPKRFKDIKNIRDRYRRDVFPRNYWGGHSSLRHDGEGPKNKRKDKVKKEGRWWEW